MHIAELLQPSLWAKTQDKTPEAKLIQDFCDEINKEREACGWKYFFEGKWRKLEPMTWIKTQQKLGAIRKDKDELQTFFTECKYEQRARGSFSRYFFYKLDTKKKQWKH